MLFDLFLQKLHGELKQTITPALLALLTTATKGKSVLITLYICSYQAKM